MALLKSELIPDEPSRTLDVLRPPGWVEVELTTDHAASSQGLPVVVYRGAAYGPADLGQHQLSVPDEMREAAVAAGYSLQPIIDDFEGDYDPAEFFGTGR